VFDVEYGAGNLSGQKGEITLLHHVKAGDGTKEGKRFKIFSPTAANVSFNLKIYRISLT
jgi:hypothetical protein